MHSSGPLWPGNARAGCHCKNAGRNVHAAAECNSQVCVIATNAFALVEHFQRCHDYVIALIAKLNVVMDKIATKSQIASTRALPAVVLTASRARYRTRFRNSGPSARLVDRNRWPQRSGSLRGTSAIGKSCGSHCQPSAGLRRCSCGSGPSIVRVPLRRTARSMALPVCRGPRGRSPRLQTMLWKAGEVWSSSHANSMSSRSMPRLIAFCLADTQAIAGVKGGGNHWPALKTASRFSHLWPLQ